MTIYLIKSDAVIGPFFSSRKKALAYLREDKAWWTLHGQAVADGTSPYLAVLDIELDNPASLVLK